MSHYNLQQSVAVLTIAIQSVAVLTIAVQSIDVLTIDLLRQWAYNSTIITSCMTSVTQQSINFNKVTMILQQYHHHSRNL